MEIEQPDILEVGIIDGLGHGEEAVLAANKVLDCLKIYYHLPLEDIFKKAHEYSKDTRRAVVSICKIFSQENKMEYAGMGNVELRVFGNPESVRIFNYNGTIGMRSEIIKVQQYKYYYGSTFVMYSDGIAEFQLDRDTLRMSPQGITRFIMEKYARTTDDATVLVVR